MTRLPSSTNDRAAAPQAFKDGLGTRERAADQGGDAVEHLNLCPEIAAQESAIRDRVGRLINFRHARYVRLRGVDRAKTGMRPLFVAYDALDGHRLSSVLESLPKMALSLEVDVALQIVRDLLPAIGILHDSRKVTHGCIGPERLVYTSQQRLVIVDQGLAAALQRMNLPRTKLWQQFRIASPATNRAVFDEKMDVVQIGLVALALLLGRPLTDDEYPAQIKRLIFGVKEQSSRIGSRPIGPELRRWLERATGVDEAQTFATIKEAQDAFETVVAVDRYAPTAAAVKSFFLRYEELLPKTAAAEADAKSSVDVESALAGLDMQITIGRRRTPAAEPQPAAEAVEVKPPAKAKAKVEPKPDAKAKPEDQAEAPADAVAAPAPASKFGRRKTDRLDALQTLQEEMNLAGGEGVSALEQTANAVYQDAASKVTGRVVDDSERLAREAAERARQEAETREQAEREGRALAEQVARDAAEQAARESADRAAAERQARAASEREALERGARQEAERQAHEASLRATREATDREAAERAARDASAREEAEREARQRLERDHREATEGLARERAEREAAREAAEREARAAAERAAKEAAERAAAEKVAREAAARAEKESVERVAAEKAAREAAERAERAERAALERAERAEREAAERADRAAKEAHERAERTAKEAAERAAQAAAERAERAEKAAQEAAEKAAREASERAERAEKAAQEAAEKAAQAAAERAERAEKAALEAAERAQREASAREAAERQAREQAEREAQRSAERAAKEATERAAAERAARDAAERAERAERDAGQRAERAAREAAERAQSEAAEREAAHRAARELAEQAVMEAAERETTHRAALQAAEQAVREAAERADIERAAREVAEQAAREASERALADLVARHAGDRGEFEAAGRAAAEKAAREHQVAAEVERSARALAEREMREMAERAHREASERAAAERSAREHAARAEAEREARAAAEREAQKSAERAAREAAERHAAERAAREAAALMEAERQARAAAEARASEASEQAAREAASREAAERAAREAASEGTGRRRRKKRIGQRTQEEVEAVQPLPSVTGDVEAAPQAAPAMADASATMLSWQPGHSVDVLPAWARGAQAPPSEPADAPASSEAASYTPHASDPYGYQPPQAEPMPAPATASIIPFKPVQPDTWMHRAPQGVEVVEESRTVAPGPTHAPRRRFRINWARTLAASLLVALLEGVAFATAWWYVTPEQQGWLVVHTKPAGIQVAVDGTLLGQTPFAKALPPGRHTIELRYGTATRVVPVEISAGVQTEQRISWGNGFNSGQASISSTIPGSKVFIDGRHMGKTPLTVSDLLPGKHEVTVEGESGTVSTMLIVEAGETTELDVPVYAGWVSVLSPVQLEIMLDGKLIGSTEIEKLMLKPGRHKLELQNDSLGYKNTVEVRVRPGATTSVSVVPKAPVTVEAPEGTELSINGENMGTLPNPTLEVPLGTAEFVMRYKDEERRMVVPATMRTPVIVKYETATPIERERPR